MAGGGGADLGEEVGRGLQVPAASRRQGLSLEYPPHWLDTPEGSSDCFLVLGFLRMLPLGKGVGLPRGQVVPASAAETLAVSCLLSPKLEPTFRRL